MATVPNPKTWQQFDQPTASQFNADIRNSLQFFSGPPRVMLRKTSGNQLIPGGAGTWRRIEWNSLDGADNDGMWSAGSPHRITAKTAGVYQVTLSVRWEWFGIDIRNDMCGHRSIMIRKNTNGSLDTSGNVEVCGDHRRASDALIPPGSNTWGSSAQSCTGFVYLNVNDHIEAWCAQGQRRATAFGSGEDVSTNIYHDIPGFDAKTCRFSAFWVQS